MLSPRELESLQRLSEDYSFPQVDVRLLRELIEAYREHHNLPKPEAPAPPKKRLIIERSNQSLDD